MLNMWVIYERPSDFPDHFVARRFEIRLGGVMWTFETRTADTLEEVRKLIPPGLFPLHRCDQDDAVITSGILGFKEKLAPKINPN